MYAGQVIFGSYLSLNYIYILVCNSLILLNKHKSKMNSDLLGTLVAGYAMLGAVSNSDTLLVRRPLSQKAP